ncbi:hypothetical protein T484DRAFT_1757141 [Baffinella frigidus]|nr:hypothetical protein T484DRAFT_1757141 [Cryptophyta sp. CCMP2293]
MNDELDTLAKGLRMVQLHEQKMKDLEYELAMERAALDGHSGQVYDSERLRRDKQRELEMRRESEMQRKLEVQRELEMRRELEMQRKLEVQRELEMRRELEMQRKLEVQRESEAKVARRIQDQLTKRQTMHINTGRRFYFDSDSDRAAAVPVELWEHDKAVYEGCAPSWRYLSDMGWWVTPVDEMRKTVYSIHAEDFMEHMRRQCKGYWRVDNVKEPRGVYSADTERYLADKRAYKVENWRVFDQ